MRIPDIHYVSIQRESGRLDHTTMFSNDSDDEESGSHLRK